MRVTIFGGHGKVALLTIPVLRQAGHDVQAVVRNPDHVADVEAAGARAVVASVEDSDRQALVDLLRGQDAVVWSAGAGGGDPARTFAVDRDAAIRSMEAAEEAGVGRYIMVSFSGAGPQHLVADDDPFRPYQDAKIAADERLRASRLAWTILGPGRLTTEGDPGGVNPDATSRQGDEAPRALVARVIVDVLEDTRSYNRTLVFGAGDVPIDDWLAGLQVPWRLVRPGPEKVLSANVDKAFVQIIGVDIQAREQKSQEPAWTVRSAVDAKSSGALRSTGR